MPLNPALHYDKTKMSNSHVWLLTYHCNLGCFCAELQLYMTALLTFSRQHCWLNNMNFSPDLLNSILFSRPGKVWNMGVCLCVCVCACTPEHPYYYIIIINIIVVIIVTIWVYNYYTLQLSLELENVYQNYLYVALNTHHNFKCVKHPSNVCILESTVYSVCWIKPFLLTVNTEVAVWE